MKRNGIFTLTLSAMLIAMSVVIGIFCKTFLNFGGGLFRITFENLPIILSGIMFGPLIATVVGVATDLISYLLSPQIYPPNLIVTLGAATIGFLSGAVSHFLIKKRGYAQIIISALAAHAVGSMIIKSIMILETLSLTSLRLMSLQNGIGKADLLLKNSLTQAACSINPLTSKTSFQPCQRTKC